MCLGTRRKGMSLAEIVEPPQTPLDSNNRSPIAETPP